MLSVQSATQPKLARPELAPLRSPRPPQAPQSAVPPSPRPVAAEGLDHWFEELQKYEVTLVCIVCQLIASNLTIQERNGYCFGRPQVQRRIRHYRAM